MKKNYLLSIIFLMTTFFHSFSQNLLTNGDFESGGSGNGFTNNDPAYTFLPQTFFGSTIPGNYTVFNSPYYVNTSIFINEGDHTTGQGKMLIIDGTTTPGNIRFWKAGNLGTGINGLIVGKKYSFSYWVKSISNEVSGLSTQADIGVQINGALGLSLVYGNSIAPLPSQSWRQVVYTFIASSTNATIELWDSNISSLGNDFAIDDISLTSDLLISYTVINASCITPNDGSITITGFGGTLPYTNFSISGAVNLSNNTGVFTNLPPGLYTISITDSSLPSATTISNSNVIIGPNLTVPNESTICIGNSIILNVGGSNSSYSWSSSPTDPSLIAPSSSNPTVSPTTSTTYTVSSTIGACTTFTKTIKVNVVSNQISIKQLPIKICSNGNRLLAASAYAFNSITNNAFSNLSGATNIITNNADDNISATNTIGFNFHFGGTDYNQFSVSTDGWLLLGNSNAISQPTNLTSSTFNTPKIYPFWDDLSTGTNGYVSYSITGVAPNRILKIEWKVTIPKNINNPANSTFQLWLFELSNTIEFHYGTMGIPASNSISSGYTINNSSFGSITFSSNTSNSNVINDTNNTIPSYGQTYIFSPITNIVWSPITNLFTDSAGTIPYSGDSRDLVYEINNSPGVSVYTATANYLGCTISATINVTNSIPLVSFNNQSNYSLCNGNSGVLSFIGTPNSVVTIFNNDSPPISYSVNIGSDGVGTFNTPPLNQTTTYSITSIKELATNC